MAEGNIKTQTFRVMQSNDVGRFKPISTENPPLLMGRSVRSTVRFDPPPVPTDMLNRAEVGNSLTHASAPEPSLLLSHRVRTRYGSFMAYSNLI